jgi:translation elongation factor EF-1alpha
MERQRFSRLLDICEEEQRKGKTMDFTEINFKYNEKNYVLIDTPGHKLFLPQMINGASLHNTNTITGCIVVSSKGYAF